MTAIKPLPLAAALALTAALPALSDTVETAAGPMEITEIAGDLDMPWGVDFLPDGGFLVTEIAGRLWRYDAEGNRTEVSGAPDVVAEGQGGLLDVAVARDFDESREIFLTYSKAQNGGAGTALMVARLNEAGDGLTGGRVLFEMADGGNTGRHFGSRVVEAEDGNLFVTIGDRGQAEMAQDLGKHNGSVVRIARDGNVPEGNPFVGQDGALPEIWTYGHRNPQGAALDGDGQLWTVEHGAQGGDEINRIEAGTNYGWPEISYGTNYNGSRIGVGTEAEGMAQPEFYWDPSIAPSGMAILSDAVPEWAGHIVVGSLKFNSIHVLDPSDWTEEVIESDETARVRDVAEAPDGSIWFISEVNGAIYRLAPTE
ncbi:MAG: PQQ-dependent sugar dehydrogenase [Pseudomonadota bacterium]|nr:PQQ-dependent sugar dehydrogenase [Pseudomonadota bacterium]